MSIWKNLLSMVLFVGLLSSCVVQNSIATPAPIDSFIYIEQSSEYVVCNTQKVECGTQNDQWSASGVLISKNKRKNKSTILTAAHVCDGPKSSPYNIIVSHKESLKGYTLEGSAHEGKVVAKSNRYDLCLIEIEYVKNKVAKLAVKEPKRGDHLYNTAAPAGVWFPNTVVLLEGIYSGKRGQDMIMSVPAAPGSSGSPIYNKRGRVVGILHSVNRRFSNVSIATRLRYIKKFLDKSKAKLKAHNKMEKAQKSDPLIDVEIFPNE